MDNNPWLEWERILKGFDSWPNLFWGKPATLNIYI